MGRGGQEGAAGVGLAPPKPPARSRGGSGRGAPGGALAPGGSRSFPRGSGFISVKPIRFDSILPDKK